MFKYICYLTVIFVCLAEENVENPEVYGDPVTIFMNIVLNDCTKMKTFLGLSYESLAEKAKLKLKDVYLILYTGNNKISFNIENASQVIPNSPFFDFTNPTTIIAHGYTGNSESLNIVNLANKIKSLGYVNVLVLDHSALTNDNYYAASTYVRYIGEALGQVLANIQNNRATKFHLIGHSLGAHICGFAGKTYRVLTGRSIEKITGLDPAGPCYFQETTDKRLTATDANFVDIIHTDINNFGLAQPIGHVDFYPNSGSKMTGCFALDIFCSHIKSLLYYIESVQNDNFISVKCSDYATFITGLCSFNTKTHMGYKISLNTEHGVYYLKTGSEPPFIIIGN